MPTRQKIIAVIIGLVLIVIIWQIIGIFRGPSTTQATPPATPVTPATPGRPTSTRAAGTPAIPPHVLTPTPVPVPPLQPTTEREASLMRLQQETQDQYLQAVNELQVLKVQRDIATTIREISNAKLERVEAEKKIIDTLSPPPATSPPAPPETAPPVVTGAPVSVPVTTAPVPPGAEQPQTPQAEARPPKPEVLPYTVVSVSYIQNRWSAVVNYKGSLFNVHVGDILPLDGSRVLAIGRSGIILQKNGVKKKFSVVTSI